MIVIFDADNFSNLMKRKGTDIRIMLFCKLNDAPFVTLNDAVPV